MPLAKRKRTFNPAGMTPPPAPSTLRIAIVGAGFSGLSAAIRCRDLAVWAGRNVALTVYEAGPNAGGLVATQRLGDYLVERGADSFITNKPAGIAMCRRLGLEGRLIATDPRHRQSFVLSHGHPVPTPAGFQLVAPTRIAPFLKSPLLSWRGKKRVLAEPGVPVRRGGGDESVASFVRRRFGSEAFDRLVQPLVGGIYTGDLERLSLSATFPRFAQMELQQGSVLRAMRRQRTSDTSGARYGLFASLPNGMSELLEAMTAQIGGGRAIEFGAVVERLSQNATGGWRVQTAGGQPEFDAAVIALPAHQAASLLAAQSPEIAAKLREFEYSSSAIVVSGHQLADIRHPLNGAGLVIPQIEKRRILAVSFASRKFPGRAPEGRVILRTFLGGALQADLLQHDDPTLRQLVLDELKLILGVSGRPDFCEVVRYAHGIPQFVLGHRERVTAIESEVRALHGLALAGNAYHGVGIPDAIQSGADAAEKAWFDLTGQAPPRFVDEWREGSIAPTSSRGDDLADSGHHSAAGLTQ